MVVVFGLGDGQGDVVPVVENIIGPFGFSPFYGFPFDDDLSVSKRNLFAHLGLNSKECWQATEYFLLVFPADRGFAEAVDAM